MQPAIIVSNLTKVYRLPHNVRKTAVDSLSLEVRAGEIFGFLGPNGAGKTTTIKMLLGFMKPTSGSATILGTPVDRSEARSTVGYLPEQPYFPKFMTPIEVVTMHAGLAGVPGKERRGQAMKVIKMVGLEELARTPVAKMSKGQVQRVGLAQALVADPQILILDEPASGLDPLGRRQVRDLLRKLRESGKTIFLSSHLLSEIETVCDRVAVLSYGKLTAIGAPDEVKQEGGRTKVTTKGISLELIEAIRRIGGEDHLLEGEISISIDASKVYDLIDLLRNAGLPLISVMPERESLEEAFLRLAA